MSVYRINGVDPETQYSLTIERGIDSQVWQMPELKDNGLSIDWAGDNGTDRYHGQRKFKSKSYTIPCVIIGTSSADMIAKYNALETFLTTTGEFNFDDVGKNRRWKVFYNKMPSITKINSTAVRFTLELIDDYPTQKFNTTQ